MKDSPENQEEVAGSPKRPDFEIGLALAGAISAGAYTAGVMDFLAQALQEWEKQRPDDAPLHRVQIRTIAGASAGAITGALGVVALSRGLKEEALTPSEIAASHRSPGQTYQSARCLMPILYEAWVKRPQMAASDADTKDLLGLNDINEQNQDSSSRAKKRAAIVSSALNAKLLDDIKANGLACPDPAPAPASYPFLSKTMHVFMTVSNLRGIPFTVNFGNAKYGMQTHGDRFHYAIDGVGTDEWAKERWLSEDKTTSLHVDDLPWNAGRQVEADTPWDAYGTCALASAAFPAGLAPRLMTTPFADYSGRQYPLPVKCGSIKADFPPRLPTETTFKFLNVDGGVVNNNPFDYAEYAIRGYPKQGSDKGKHADRAVLMIAPFPEPPAFLPEDQPVPELVSIIRSLFPTLINQARFRASELGVAMDPDIYSRFLISPSRSIDNGDPERYAIACGLLSGFGGFLHEEFRAHDYQLGRRNCQRFLASTFGLPDTNAAIVKTPAPRRVALTNYQGKVGEPGPHSMIVPLVGDAVPEVALPHWPQMTGEDFRTLMTRIEKRLDAVVGPLIEAQTTKSNVRLAARAAVYFAHDRIMKYIETAILSDLVRRNQITGWDLPKGIETNLGKDSFDDVRAILAVLVTGPAPAAKIVRATHRDETFIRRALTILEHAPTGSPCSVVGRMEGEDISYMLRMHVPQGIRALPVLGGLIERWRPSPYPYA